MGVATLRGGGVELVGEWSGLGDGSGARTLTQFPYVSSSHPLAESAAAFCQQHTVASQGGFYVILHPCIQLSRRICLLVCLFINILCGKLGKWCNGHNHSIYCVHDVAKTSCTTCYVCASYINMHGKVFSL
jgi:hypothetical protein